MIYLHLKATNDINGNPRRLFLVIRSNGEILEAINEGYRGNQVAKKYPEIHQGPTIETTAIVIRQLLKHHKAN